jgi:hypothetical protein
MKISLPSLSATIHRRVDGRNNVFLKVSGHFSGKQMLYFAASPPDRHLSYSGSALPFPSESFAYEGTTSKGLIQTGSFEFVIPYPNSHYIDATGVLLKPYIRFVLDTVIHDVVIGDQLIANRSLTGLPNRPDRSEMGGNGSGGKN